MHEDILKKFTAADVPHWGPEEEEIDPPSWKVSSAETDPSLPGGGLSRYPMLYIGEGCNKMFLVINGKVAWTYSTGKGWEYDDVWMLSNGNILFTRMSWLGEVTPQKKLAWRMDIGKNQEVHSVQPIGLDKVLVMINGFPPRLMIINKRTGMIELERVVSHNPVHGVHGQFRRIRMTAAGTFLVPYLTMNRVVEYDTDMREVWSYPVKSPWAAIRLKNGNTLITDEQDQITIEVDLHGKIVWQIRLSDLPMKYRLADSQSCVRLDNGNTILCSRGDNGNSPQLVEVNEKKEILWVLNDWKNLGPATAVQILSESGISENPGECQR
jgi:hypothetical protein